MINPFDIFREIQPELARGEKEIEFNRPTCTLQLLDYLVQYTPVHHEEFPTMFS
jgi:hypothetical protein